MPRLQGMFYQHHPELSHDPRTYLHILCVALRGKATGSQQREEQQPPAAQAQ